MGRAPGRGGGRATPSRSCEDLGVGLLRADSMLAHLRARAVGCQQVQAAAAPLGVPASCVKSPPCRRRLGRSAFSEDSERPPPPGCRESLRDTLGVPGNGGWGPGRGNGGHPVAPPFRLPLTAMGDKRGPRGGACGESWGGPACLGLCLSGCAGSGGNRGLSDFQLDMTGVEESHSRYSSPSSLPPKCFFIATTPASVTWVSDRFRLDSAVSPSRCTSPLPPLLR